MLLAVFFPFARLNPAFEENQRTLFQILPRDLGLLAPHDDLVPFRALLLRTALIFEGFIRRDREIRNGRVAVGESRLRISPETAHQDRLVDHSSSLSPPRVHTISVKDGKRSCARAEFSYRLNT